jgi:hypothetical protein
MALVKSMLKKRTLKPFLPWGRIQTYPLKRKMKPVSNVIAKEN